MEKFLELLAETAHKHPGNWLTVGPGAVRFVNSFEKCPIEFLYFDKFGNKDMMKHPQTMAMELGLTPEEALSVIKAADNYYGHDRDLREKMLEIITKGAT